MSFLELLFHTNLDHGDGSLERVFITGLVAIAAFGARVLSRRLTRPQP